MQWFPGGVFDTKYLSRQLPQVFDNWTGLSDVYKAVAEGERERLRPREVGGGLSRDGGESGGREVRGEG